jgi:hypothetical protein
MTQNATSDILGGIVDFFQEMADVTIDAIAGVATSSGQIFEEMVNFFKEDEWPFTRLKDSQFYRWLSKGKMANGLATPRLELNKSSSSFTQFAPSTPQKKAASCGRTFH